MAAFAVVSVLASLLSGLGLLGATAASAATGDPSGVSFTLAGCRNSGQVAGETKYQNSTICNDADYTTGNLGKGWNELDLVPYRVTATAGNSAPSNQTYTVAVAADYNNAGHPGYDVISTPVVTSGTCSVTPGAQTVTPDGSQIYRKWTITQSGSTTCQFDYYDRLALGSHTWPGSSLHSYLENQDLGTSGIGSKDVPIPVNQILPQSLSKTMSAAANGAYVWSVKKGVDNAAVNFTNTCSANPADDSAKVNVTMTFTKSASNLSDYTVTTAVYATNPASRTITVSGDDVIYTGNTQLTDVSIPATDVPANSASYPLISDTEDYPVSSITTAGGPSFNDIATVTYTDKLTGVTVPGSTTATASVANTAVSSGTEANDSVDLSDLTTLTGGNLQYSIDSTDNGGDFTDQTTSSPYTLGTATTDPIMWTLDNQSSSITVHLAETVYVDAAATTTGSLSDTATVSSGGTAIATDSASSTVDASPLVFLTIDKTIPDVLGANDGTETFHFDVAGQNSGYANTVDITFGQGDGGSLKPKSVDLPNLVPDDFMVTEQQAGYGYTTAAPVSSGAIAPDPAIGLPSCSGSVVVHNLHDLALAQVKKITAPTGNEANWTFTLSGTDTNNQPIPPVQAVTTGAGYVQFPGNLVEGTYTVTETAKPGWDNTGAGESTGTQGQPVTDPTIDSSAHTCTFSVNYPADADNLYSCAFQNTEEGSITVVKQANPQGSTSFPFTTTGSGLSSFNLVDDGTNDGLNSHTFTGLTPGSGYSVTEGPEPAHWDLTSASCSSTNGSSSFSRSGATESITLGAGDAVTCTYGNTEESDVTVVKTENGQVPSLNYSFELSGGPVDETLTTNSTNQGTLDFGYLAPGNYQLCELHVPAGTASTLQTGYGGTEDPNTGTVCLNFTLSAGSNQTFTVDNSHPQGNALTIGYWKHWNTCTLGSKAAATSAKTGNTLMDGLLPVTLGNYYTVSNCTQGVAVLTNPAGKYAENQLAAQLLAAKLNIKAGAAHHADVDNAITAASNLLTTIHYIGPKSTVIGANSPYRAQATNLATTLNNYNNGLIV